MLLAGTAIVFSVLDSNSIKIERDRKTAAALAEAKEALIGWSVAHPNWPGIMPFPDRNDDSGGYDGKSDCVTSGLSENHLLGELPLLGGAPCVTPQTGLSIDSRDGSGERLWYAVSRNLIRTSAASSTPVINPGIINTPTYPWMIVRDKDGQVISNRVVVVIIAPGSPVGSQNRSGGAAEANAYLDAFTIGAVSYSNYNYPVNSSTPFEFVMGEDMQNVPDSDTTYQHPYYFNDKLIYITIDELMAALEKRAAQEAASKLRSYYAASSSTAANRFYPYAATLGDTNNTCVENTLTGGLSLVSAATSASASCASHDCTVSFPMTVKFTRDVADAYTSATGSCSRLGNTCTCTGAGSCVKSGAPSHTFTCDADGDCSSTINPNGSYTFTYTPQSPDVTTTSGNCSGGNGSVTCTGTGSFSSSGGTCTHPNPGLATLPSWFTDNRWQDFMYYAISTDCNYATPGCASGSLTVGAKANIHALVISAGRMLGTQLRPSANIADYLDSVENTDLDSVFDAVGTPRSSTYNDQMFIVAPK